MLTFIQLLKLDKPLQLRPGKFADISSDLSAHLERRPKPLWWLGLSVSLFLLGIGAVAAYNTVYEGIGLWGVNQTVGWGWGITNFVWWIGIGHAGTFISAILLLFGQKWRTSINRAAEAMTIFAVLCAAFYPIIHMGRQAFFFFTFPYPNTRNLWVNFNSPLTWDVFAISTYFLLSLVYWYIGMVPDIAVIRDRGGSRIKKWFYGVLSMGWSGSAGEWMRFEKLNYLLACLATPLVLSVHSIVSMDFATSIVPGWHSTIFPPYFVAGAIFSGFAMVQILLMIVRKALNLEAYITTRHFELMNKILIITGSMVALAYFTEIFLSFVHDNPYERYVILNRMTGPYRIGFIVMMLFNVAIPQLFWIRKIRANLTISFLFAILINIGMWFERFVIVVSSIHRDYLPARWSMYYPEKTEVFLFLGTFGFFFTCFLLFARFFPVVSIAEVKASINPD